VTKRHAFVVEKDNVSCVASDFPGDTAIFEEDLVDIDVQQLGDVAWQQIANGTRSSG